MVVLLQIKGRMVESDYCILLERQSHCCSRMQLHHMTNYYWKYEGSTSISGPEYCANAWFELWTIHSETKITWSPYMNLFHKYFLEQQFILPLLSYPVLIDYYYLAFSNYQLHTYMTLCTKLLNINYCHNGTVARRLLMPTLVW